MIWKGRHVQWTWKVWGGSGRGRFQGNVLAPAWRGWVKSLISGQNSRSIIEPGTFRIRVMSFSTWANLIGAWSKHRSAHFCHPLPRNPVLLHACNWFIFICRYQLLWIILGFLTHFLIHSCGFMPKRPSLLNCPWRSYGIWHHVDL